MRILPAIVLCGVALMGCKEDAAHTISSPDKSLKVSVSLTENGEPQYSVTKDEKVVLEQSRLGVTLDDANLAEGLKLVKVSGVETVRDHYQMVNAKQSDITYHANEQTFTLANIDGRELDIVFRLSNDGVAFRYEFPGKSSDVKKVESELTSFDFESDAKAWLQPIAVAQTGYKNTNPSYEEYYEMQIPVGTESPSPAGWVFPALFQTSGNWVLISETNIDGNFHASRLDAKSPEGEYSVAMPMAPEVYTNGNLKAQAKLPFHSPWRLIAVGSLATIVESTLGTDLADPAVAMDTSFVTPGQASWSWALLKDDSIYYEKQKEFIDYAADMQWEYTLVDVNWDTRIGYDRIAELADYAASKGVGLLLWYNSSGAWNETEYTPKSRLLTHESRVREFSRIQEMGIAGVKIDFFAGDGQSMMEYYVDIIKDAADHELLVNFHGSSLPRGLQRTYPNLMTMEAVRGFEYKTFEQANADEAASHSAMLPFARNVFDPMDYTPTTFSEVPGIKRITTNGLELAQTVIFLSGIQHIAETPEGMAKAPDYVQEYMRELPNQWDESKFIQGFPGELVVIARRAGDRWYVAGINGENVQKSLSLDLSFIGGKRGQLITDDNHPRRMREASVSASDKVAVEIEGNGGFVMVFE